MAPLLNPPPKRILVKEVNWLGDLVMSLPALRAVRHSFPDAHLAVLVKQELAGFFDGIGWVNEVIPYAAAGGIRKIPATIPIVNSVRAGNFDLAILFPNSFESALWMMLARVPRRAGYITDARGAMLTHKATPPAAAMSGHQVRYWLAMVRETVGCSDGAVDLALRPSDDHLRKMREWLAAHRNRNDASIIAVAPAAAFGPAKEWPAIHFVRLIDELAEFHNAECVLVGAPGERQRCEQIASAARSTPMIAAGETGVGELIGLLALADGFVGNDSGAMHIAAALGRPTVGIFGSTNPERTGPLGSNAQVLWRRLDCSPCLARTCRFGHYNCLKEITPEDTMVALMSLKAVR